MTRDQEISNHPSSLSAITRQYPNTIKLLASQHPIDKYTCLVHALGFTCKPEYVAIARRKLNVFAGLEFGQWLLDNKLLTEVTPSDARPGDLVFYFNEKGQFKHAGLVVVGDRVQSKWGVGHLFEHDLIELPESYGMKVRFFGNLSFDDAYACFRCFAEGKGMALD